MVSTGSEGRHGTEQDIELWKEIHSYPEIDYANIHILPYNWGWARPERVEDDVERAKKMTADYVDEHVAAIAGAAKPIVIEEFGFPRDSMAISRDSATTGRDSYYNMVFSLPAENPGVAGVNFWGWGGYAEPAHKAWEPGDDYTGDPAQEDQGLNSVFATDKSTLEIIREAASRVRK